MSAVPAVPATMYARPAPDDDEQDPMRRAPVGEPLPPNRARTLLRKLRDLNLSSTRIAVDPGLSVAVAGCASLDLPAESQLRYRVRAPLCGDEELSIGFVDGRLVLARYGADGERRASVRVPILGGARGPATIPALRARIDPESAGPRETERFLRRLVRAVFPRT